MIRCSFCDHKNPPGAKSCTKCRAELLQSEVEDGQIDHEKLAGLILDGRKIEAIKLYREYTGAGLKESKDAVKALERSASRSAPEPAPTAANSDLLSLLRSGRKIEAIKQYRNTNGVGLAEAKRAVEAMAAEQGILTPRSGCAGVLILSLAAMWIIAQLW